MTEKKEKMQCDQPPVILSIRRVWDVPACLLFLFLVALDEMEPGLVAMIRAYLEGLFTEARGYFWKGASRLLIWKDLEGIFYSLSTVVEQDILEPLVLTGCYSRHAEYAHHIPGDFDYTRSLTMTRISVDELDRLPLNNWDVSNVTLMFNSAIKCNHLYDSYTFRESLFMNNIDIVPSKRLFQRHHYLETPQKVRRTKIQKGGIRIEGKSIVRYR